MIGSYLDYNDLVIVSPEHLLVSGCFFLGAGALRLKASAASPVINGLVIRDNEFDYAPDGGPAIKLDETDARFTALLDCVIDGNMLANGYTALTTRVSRRFHFVSDPTPGTLYCFDLRDSLLFPHFNASSVQATLHMPAQSAVKTPLSLVVVPGRADGSADGRPAECLHCSRQPDGRCASVSRRHARPEQLHGGQQPVSQHSSATASSTHAPHTASDGLVRTIHEWIDG